MCLPNSANQLHNFIEIVTTQIGIDDIQLETIQMLNKAVTGYAPLLHLEDDVTPAKFKDALDEVRKNFDHDNGFPTALVSLHVPLPCFCTLYPYENYQHLF